jgi:hypothetical protein
MAGGVGVFAPLRPNLEATPNGTYPPTIFVTPLINPSPASS